MPDSFLKKHVILCNGGRRTFEKSRWARIILYRFELQYLLPPRWPPRISLLTWRSSTSPGVVGYFVYYGPASGIYTSKLDAGLNIRKTIPNLQAGKTYYFTVTAYDAYGDESIPANEFQYTTPGLLPSSLSGSNPRSINLQFPVARGHWYEIQASSNLKSWTTINVTSVAVSNILTRYTDPQAVRFTSRFYRLILH